MKFDQQKPTKDEQIFHVALFFNQIVSKHTKHFNKSYSSSLLNTINAS